MNLINFSSIFGAVSVLDLCVGGVGGYVRVRAHVCVVTEFVCTG